MSGRSVVEPVERFSAPYTVTRIPMSALDMAAAARLMARGSRGVLGIPTMPWRQQALAASGLQVAQGAAMMHNPMAYGQRYF